MFMLSFTFQRDHTPYLRTLIFADCMAAKSQREEKIYWEERFRNYRIFLENHGRGQVYRHAEVRLFTHGSVLVNFQISIDKDTISLIKNDLNVEKDEDKFTPG